MEQILESILEQKPNPCRLLVPGHNAYTWWRRISGRWRVMEFFRTILGEIVPITGDSSIVQPGRLMSPSTTNLQSDPLRAIIARVLTGGTSVSNPDSPITAQWLSPLSRRKSPKCTLTFTKTERLGARNAAHKRDTPLLEPRCICKFKRFLQSCTNIWLPGFFLPILQ